MAAVIALGILGASAGAGCGGDPDPSPTGGGGTDATGGAGGMGGSGGTGGTGGTGSMGGIPLVALTSEFGKLVCERLFTCCDAQERESVLSGGGTVPTTQAECEKAGPENFYPPLYDFNQVPGYIDVGQVTYDGEKAAACLAKLKSSCDAFDVNEDILEQGPDCQAIFAGVVADGGDCTHDEQCISTTSRCMDYVCKPLLGEGQPCISGPSCQEGLACIPDANGNLACAKLKPGGTECTDGFECESSECDAMTYICTAAMPSTFCDGM
jgi:hypothetical protein